MGNVTYPIKSLEMPSARHSLCLVTAARERVMKARPEIPLIETLGREGSNLTLRRAPKDSVMLITQTSKNKMIYWRKNATLSIVLNQQLNSIPVSKILNFTFQGKQLHHTESLWKSNNLHNIKAKLYRMQFKQCGIYIKTHNTFVFKNTGFIITFLLSGTSLEYI